MLKIFKRPIKDWLKFIVWGVIFILFILWVGNLWWLLLLPLILDRFVTKYIPWDWWKKIKNKNLHTVLSWLDAIVFALVAVYFINLYLFQNYQIPTSSLEKSLLVGDFLFVSKASYGPRVPNTPLSFPLVQHTFPWGNKSYSNIIQWKYRRLKGWDKVEKGDIVVFNFPTGDTVPVKVNNPDYYSLIFNAGLQKVIDDSGKNPNDLNIDSLKDKIYSEGRRIIHSDKAQFGDVVWRPVDRRENYVKRCVATPGDTLQIINNRIFINGKIEEDFPEVQYNYFVQTDGTTLTNEFFKKLKISNEDRGILNNPYMALQLGLDNAPAYFFPMTQQAKSKVEKLSYIKKIVIQPAPDSRYNRVFPLYASYGWDRDNYGAIVIPKKATSVELTIENLPVYEHIIKNYEGNTLDIKDGKIFINNKETSSYTFQMDYYWMMGDNRHNSADSRYFGFVPEDHIVGRPVFVWLSLDKDTPWFKGKIRWNRFGKGAAR
ncbi:MAG: S26 family signal peptidase [Prevotellaceae bacterium]|jgi:signal peptidase I|nr:S26 family signal peptidase [Prevotellaceae bacterium]